MNKRQIITADLIAKEVLHLIEHGKTNAKGRAQKEISVSDLALSLDEFDSVLLPILDQASGEPQKELPTGAVAACRVKKDRWNSLVAFWPHINGYTLDVSIWEQV